MTTYWERRYCLPCMVNHWVQVTPSGIEICHGEHYDPLHIPNTYVKHVAGGRRYAVIPTRNSPAAQPNLYDTLANQRQDW